MADRRKIHGSINEPPTGSSTSVLKYLVGSQKYVGKTERWPPPLTVRGKGQATYIYSANKQQGI